MPFFILQGDRSDSFLLVYNGSQNNVSLFTSFITVNFRIWILEFGLAESLSSIYS